jgi:hypothetical protein
MSSLPVRFQRYIRGRAEWRQLSKADCVIVSFGKSGRTWLRFLLSRYYQLRYGLPADALLHYDNLHRRNPAVPKFHFTHDNYIADYTGNRDSKVDYSDRNVVLLVRDPRDTAVSQYFQWKFRMTARKKWINGYPGIIANPSLIEFVMSDTVGLPKIVRFMNGWAQNLTAISRHHLIRYEDLRADQIASLGGLLQFLGEYPTPAELADCGEFASIENMRRLEATEAATVLGRRLQPGDQRNPDSFKVRRGKVGGYRDYFTPEQQSFLDTLVARELSPFFGYPSSCSASMNSAKGDLGEV